MHLIQTLIALVASTTVNEVVREAGANMSLPFAAVHLDLKGGLDNVRSNGGCQLDDVVKDKAYLKIYYDAGFSIQPLDNFFAPVNGKAPYAGILLHINRLSDSSIVKNYKTLVEGPQIKESWVTISIRLWLIDYMLSEGSYYTNFLKKFDQILVQVTYYPDSERSNQNTRESIARVKKELGHRISLVA